MLLRVDYLSVAYGVIEALHGISLEVDEGEIVALIGSNGAGKTTTLNAISGIVPARSGKIVFAGRPIQGTPAPKVVGLGISQVPEGRHIFAEMTVQENLELGAYLRRDLAGVRQDADYVFDLFPILRERRHQVAGTLSGGEQQMLAIGRALMARPRLLLLDEPSMGLAPLLVQQVFAILETINAQGTTILLVEQNAHMALKVAQRAYVLETGRIALAGGASELAASPEVQRAYLGG